MADNREETVWLVRSVSLPVAECLSGEWKDFMRILHVAWRESTQLANWASQTLARLDVVRTPGMPQLPPLAKVDLYALAFGRARPGKPRKEGAPPLPVVEAQYGGTAWEGAKIAAASLLRWVETKYRKERGKVVWRRERRTPEYLYPVPFPVHQQSWEVWFDERQQPVVSLTLPGGRVSLRLRRGPLLAGAIKILERIAEGELGKQELKICRQRDHASHRRVGTEQQPGGRSKDSYRIMLRIAYRLEARAEREGVVATLTTGADPLLRLAVAGSHEWVYHGLQAKDWIASHRRYLDAFADEEKFERRFPSSRRRRHHRHRERKVERHANRMRSYVQEAASQTVNHCLRNKVSSLHYNDTDRSFAPEFPWFALAERLAQKCHEAGVRFVAASGTVMKTAQEEEAAATADGD